MSPARDPLINEARRLEDDCLWTATTHYAAATWAARLRNFLGSIPIILGATGGWNVLTDPENASEDQLVIAGVLSLTAGIMGSLLSFWNLGQVRRDHLSSARDYKVLQHEARRAREVYAGLEDEGKFRERIETLTAKYDGLIRTTVQPMNLAYWIAGRRIKKGVFESDLAIPNGSSPSEETE